jgi:hypothetical protein
MIKRFNNSLFYLLVNYSMYLATYMNKQFKVNVSEWSDMFYPLTVVSVSYHNKNPTKRIGLVQSGSILNLELATL